MKTVLATLGAMRPDSLKQAVIGIVAVFITAGSLYALHWSAEGGDAEPEMTQEQMRQLLLEMILDENERLRARIAELEEGGGP